MSRYLTAALTVGILSSCGTNASGTDFAGAKGDGLANVSGQIFLVQLDPSVDVDATLDALSHGNAAPVVHRYHSALHGGALMVPNEAARLNLASDPRVIQIEQDQPVYAIGKPAGGATDAGTVVVAQKSPTGYRLIGADTNLNKGVGVRVAVLDTGVDLTHPDLVANLDTAYGKDCVNEAGATFLDNNGHGSHVSGTIVAANNTFGSVGIATAAKVVPVKVLNRQGSGSFSTIICGIDHVTANAAFIKVANMSLGGSGKECATGATGCTKSLMQVAIEKSVAAGVTYAVAAGNESVDASTKVPAAFSVAITVSAYSDANGIADSADGWASFTNYGSVVDIAAPGVGIYSTWKGGGYNTISGTSMASPHVAAAAALYISTHPGSSPQQVRDQLVANALTTFTGSTHAQHAEPLLDARALTLCTVTCATQGFDCGTYAANDGCGGPALDCGTCGGVNTCAGSGTANVCGCTPTLTCEAAGCGTHENDGCGVPLVCDACPEL
jgi:subtilisin